MVRMGEAEAPPTKPHTKNNRHSELLAACGRYFRISVLRNSATVGSRRIKATNEEDEEAIELSSPYKQFLLK